MSIEEQIKMKLRMRGFSEKAITNNRGLIGAIIEDMMVIYSTKMLEK